MPRCDISDADFSLEVDFIYNFTKEFAAHMNLSDQSQILYHIKAKELHCIQTRKKPTVACRPISFLNYRFAATDSKETHSTIPFNIKNRRLYE